MWHILEQSAHPIRLYCVHHRKTLSDMIFMLGSMKLKIRSFGAFVILARWWQSKQVVLVQKSVMCLRNEKMLENNKIQLRKFLTHLF